MDAVVIGDDQTNVSIFPGDRTWPIRAKFTSPLLSASFYGGELNCDIRKELSAICGGEVSDVQIATQDGFFIMDMKKDSLGHIEVAAEGRCYSMPEIHARMVFRIDQSYLPAAIASAQHIFRFGYY